MHMLLYAYIIIIQYIYTHVHIHTHTVYTYICTLYVNIYANKNNIVALTDGTWSEKMWNTKVTPRFTLSWRTLPEYAFIHCW